VKKSSSIVISFGLFQFLSLYFPLFPPAALAKAGSLDISEPDSTVNFS